MCGYEAMNHPRLFTSYSKFLSSDMYLFSIWQTIQTIRRCYTFWNRFHSRNTFAEFWEFRPELLLAVNLMQRDVSGVYPLEDIRNSGNSLNRKSDRVPRIPF
jgi:hypothetical protein